MKIFRTVKEYKKYFNTIQKNKIIGFVPTMGALHNGHLSLLKKSLQKCDITGISIFVNPLQFAPDDDIEQYPRQEKKDIKICEELDVDFAFIPKINEMYPEKILTMIVVSNLQDNLCGEKRKGHFNGVTTVVAKLFNIIQPNFAFFGLKDFQQYIIIKKMVKDLIFPIEIIGCEIIRERNGLAMSSRNRYLTKEEREIAPNINKALRFGIELIKEQKLTAGKIIENIRTKYLKEIKIDYLNIYDQDTLIPLEKDKIPSGKIAIAGAFFIGKARLIDNMRISL